MIPGTSQFRLHINSNDSRSPVTVASNLSVNNGLSPSHLNSSQDSGVKVNPSSNQIPTILDQQQIHQQFRDDYSLSDISVIGDCCKPYISGPLDILRNLQIANRLIPLNKKTKDDVFDFIEKVENLAASKKSLDKIDELSKEALEILFADFDAIKDDATYFYLNKLIQSLDNKLISDVQFTEEIGAIICNIIQIIDANLNSLYKNEEMSQQEYLDIQVILKRQIPEIDNYRTIINLSND